ncbi:MAG: hypothetical protein JSU94_06070 [Phycisphaerales bacterium]|nr:MAG: hypothetical protein JSU94_06070 [Phycisphaerales bacterium]
MRYCIVKVYKGFAAGVQDGRLGLFAAEKGNLRASEGVFADMKKCFKLFINISRRCYATNVNDA